MGQSDFAQIINERGVGSGAVVVVFTWSISQLLWYDSKYAVTLLEQDRVVYENV